MNHICKALARWIDKATPLECYLIGMLIGTYVFIVLK